MRQAAFRQNGYLKGVDLLIMYSVYLAGNGPANQACFCRCSKYHLPMSTIQEIKAAIESLTPAQRAELDHLLRQPAEPLDEKKLLLPDYAARRRRIMGDKVYPNPVLEARELERT
jgi:hypothetical protein